MKKYTLATIDAETDPFQYGRKPEPFCWGLYTGKHYYEAWGDQCTEKIISIIEDLREKHIIYAHNGGKFDFFYLLEKGVLADPIRIINGRIVSAKIGQHELRDSFAILPVPLAAYQKEQIDYDWFEADQRETYRTDILHYLASDCEYLYELVDAFISEFGLNLTIGGTAIKKIKEFHPFESQNDKHDEYFRPFYFGGRTQCFSRGKVEGDFKSYDVNSMYPYVMKCYNHPTGKDYEVYYDNDVCSDFADSGYFGGNPDTVYFIEFEGRSEGALCTRTDDGLDFGYQSGTFRTMSHELQIGLKYGLIDIHRINSIAVPCDTINFGRFVLNYIADKIQAKKDGNKTKELFSKLLLNSGYGKFGQNPENFYDWKIRYEGEECPDLDIWELYLDTPYCEMWRCPSPKPIYYDVATAASITSAARSVLLEALCNSINPQYCDTDSIICEGINNVRFDPFELGAWDIEAQGDSLHLGGKKLYALFDGETPVKYASKGARLSPNDIKKIAQGDIIHWRNEAPNFRLTGEVKFIERTLKIR